jgi:2-(1,2-epoxy-1,2-dihydrophenyl)acetyl-CoA isomerase
VETVLYDVTNGVATITMNRPEGLNAVNAQLGDELAKAISDAASDRNVRCAVLTGAGRGFCAGADLNQFEEAYQQGIVPPMGEVLKHRYNPLALGLYRMEKPTVAAVNGVAAGMGASLALACDFRIASEHAKFFQAFIKIGVIPDSGATFFLPRLVGIAKAKELAMLGPMVKADEALRIGLVTEVVKADEFPARVKEFAEMLASGPTKAYALTKQALHIGAESELEDALGLEADLQQQIAQTADHMEGVKAFLEKRGPKFQGK